MIVASQGKQHVFHGEDLHDLAAWLQATPRAWSSRCSETNTARPSWDLGVGYDGAWKLAHDGWSEGARDIETGEVQAMAHDMLRVKTMDFAGELPDVARYVAGELKHMHHRRKAQQPIVHLIVNLWTSGGTDAKQFVTYGRAVLALVDQIESSGKRVELDCTLPTTCNGYPICAGWKIKRAADALDPGAVAFSIAHPAALRRIGFAICERAPRPADDMGAYGYQTELTPFMRNALDADNATVLPGLGIAHGYTEKQTNDRLRQHMLTAGVEVRLED